MTTRDALERARDSWPVSIHRPTGLHEAREDIADWFMTHAYVVYSLIDAALTEPTPGDFPDTVTLVWSAGRMSMLQVMAEVIDDKIPRAVYHKFDPRSENEKNRADAEAEVLKIRGSHDVPGFDACVNAVLAESSGDEEKYMPCTAIKPCGNAKCPICGVYNRGK